MNGLANNCRHYDGCEAQLCPMRKGNRLNCWYPGEEICKRTKDVPKWVKQQRKIAKKIIPENASTYFTVAMLSVGFRVTKNLKGLDPDRSDFELQEIRWLKQHKADTRKISDAVRQRKQELINMARMGGGKT